MFYTSAFVLLGFVLSELVVICSCLGFWLLLSVKFLFVYVFVIIWLSVITPLIA